MQERIEAPVTAGFFPRLAAYLIDRLLLLLALGMVRFPAWISMLSGESVFSTRVLFDHSLLQVLCYVLALAYFVLLTWCGGATLGKRALGLRVVNARGQDCSFWTLLFRESVGRYLSGILCIGYILIFTNNEHQALHDRLCDTYVVWAQPAPHRTAAAPAHRLSVVSTDDPKRDWYKPYRV